MCKSRRNLDVSVYVCLELVVAAIVHCIVKLITLISFLLITDYTQV